MSGFVGSGVQYSFKVRILALECGLFSKCFIWFSFARFGCFLLLFYFLGQSQSSAKMLIKFTRDRCLKRFNGYQDHISLSTFLSLISLSRPLFLYFSLHLSLQTSLSTFLPLFFPLSISLSTSLSLTPLSLHLSPYVSILCVLVFFPLKASISVSLSFYVCQLIFLDQSLPPSLSISPSYALCAYLNVSHTVFVSITLCLSVSLSLLYSFFLSL